MIFFLLILLLSSFNSYNCDTLRDNEGYYYEGRIITTYFTSKYIAERVIDETTNSFMHRLNVYSFDKTEYGIIII